MASVMVMQGRQIGEREIDWMRGLLASHPVNRVSPRI
jgi:hypothetical protein